MESEAFKELLDNDGRLYEPIPHLVEGEEHLPAIGDEWIFSDMDFLVESPGLFACG